MMDIFELILRVSRWALCNFIISLSLDVGVKVCKWKLVEIFEIFMKGFAVKRRLNQQFERCEAFLMSNGPFSTHLWEIGWCPPLPSVLNIHRVREPNFDHFDMIVSFHVYLCYLSGRKTDCRDCTSTGVRRCAFSCGPTRLRAYQNASRIGCTGRSC